MGKNRSRARVTDNRCKPSRRTKPFIWFISRTSQTQFHMKYIARRLFLKQKQKVTLNWLLHIILFYFLLISSFLFLTLSGIECYACSSQPELLGGTKCESGKAEKITCDPSLFNRCMTVKFTGSLGASGSMSLELRNCSNILFCDPDSQFSRK